MQDRLIAAGSRVAITGRNQARLTEAAKAIGARPIKADVSTGMQLQAAMDSTKLFPNMVIQMVAIGEESGELDKMLGKVADFYEEEVDNAVASLSSLIEPMIMAVLGGIVGTLVIAMYLPIFKMASVV